MSIGFHSLDQKTGELEFGFRLRRPFSRERLQFVNVGKSRTQQSFKDECDVNRIIDRFSRTGALPLAGRTPFYDDVTALQVDLTEAWCASVDVLDKTRDFFANYERDESPPPAVTDVPPAQVPPVVK